MKPYVTVQFVIDFRNKLRKNNKRIGQCKNVDLSAGLIAAIIILIVAPAVGIWVLMRPKDAEKLVNPGQRNLGPYSHYGEKWNEVRDRADRLPPGSRPFLSPEQLSRSETRILCRSCGTTSTLSLDAKFCPVCGRSYGKYARDIPTATEKGH